MMRRLLRRPSIAMQIVIFLVLSEAAFQALIAVDTYVVRSGMARRCDSPRSDGFAYAVRIYNALPESSRPAHLTAMRQAFPNADVKLLPSDTRVSVPSASSMHVWAITSVLGKQHPVLLPVEAEAPDGRVLVRLDDGRFIAATVPCRPPPQERAYDALVRGLFYAFVVLPLLIWWMRRNIRVPLKRFEAVANDFSLTLDPIDLQVVGPREIRRATQALNAASARIRSLVNERQRMLGAVSHDLLTPLTRLRLRAEFIEDAKLRDDMSRDIDQMAAMTEATLRFLVDGRGVRNLSAVDIATVLSTVVDQFTDMNHTVSYQGPAHLIVEADPVRIERAVTNLVGNAVKYGTRATVSLQLKFSQVLVDVDDDGPGIPDSEKELMMEPFMRGDKARPIDGSSFGLGLSIVKTIAEQHGGRLILLDAKPKGLKARLVFPFVKPATKLSKPT
ncbi:HAMP domain protein (plasmid) [Bosea sp. RAC05]|nr:HAMP domain protein [Bosea sp. RAC05]